MADGFAAIMPRRVSLRHENTGHRPAVPSRGVVSKSLRCQLGRSCLFAGSLGRDVQDCAEFCFGELFEETGSGVGFARGLGPISFTGKTNDVCGFWKAFLSCFRRDDTRSATDALNAPTTSRIVGQPAHGLLTRAYLSGCHEVTRRLIYGQSRPGGKWTTLRAAPLFPV